MKALLLLLYRITETPTGMEREAKGAQRGGTPYGNRPILVMQETFYLCHSQQSRTCAIVSSHPGPQRKGGGKKPHKQKTLHQPPPPLFCIPLCSGSRRPYTVQETSHALSTCLQQ